MTDTDEIDVDMAISALERAVADLEFLTEIEGGQYSDAIRANSRIVRTTTARLVKLVSRL